jgi:hypothetical protein
MDIIHTIINNDNLDIGLKSFPLKRKESKLLRSLCESAPPIRPSTSYKGTLICYQFSFFNSDFKSQYLDNLGYIFLLVWFSGWITTTNIFQYRHILCFRDSNVMNEPEDSIEILKPLVSGPRDEIKENLNYMIDRIYNKKIAKCLLESGV